MHLSLVDLVVNRKERSERRFQREGGLSKLLALGGGYKRGVTFGQHVLNTRVLCQVKTYRKSRFLQRLLAFTKKNEGSHTFL